MEHIVIGIDAEPASSLAIDWVIQRAHHAPVDVTLVTAFDSLVDDPMAARDRQLALADRIRSANPEVQVEIELANASIHRALEERSEGADLLVIGSHRTRPLRSMLAGSVPSLIAARSHCPTVIVPDDWTPHDGDIVVGVSTDGTSDPALIFGAQEAHRRSSILRLVHAWQITSGGAIASSVLIAPPIRDERDAHRVILDAAGTRLRAAQPHARVIEQLVDGRTADALLGGETAGLIVIGTHHHEPAVGLVLGSTGGHLLRRSRVPVCIVPDMGARLDDVTAGAEHNWAAGIGDLDARVLDPLGLGSL
jgi:nucleotide-binding universal stress UspA family protein